MDSRNNHDSPTAMHWDGKPKVLTKGVSECMPNRSPVDVVYIHDSVLVRCLNSKPVVLAGEGSDFNQSLVLVNWGRVPTL